MNKSSWMNNENYYMRLARLGWKFAYRSNSKDCYSKRNWIVIVPCDIRVNPFFHRSSNHAKMGN